MDTSKYAPETRKQIKRDQRSPGYQDLKRRFAEQRAQLETKLRERNDAITRLTQKLVAAGVPAEEVAKLAA
jgi:predicted nuclease with TOPRIM domain